jgi:hypothetical protein
MDTIGSDVLSRYPLLSQKLRNSYLSKQIHEDTLQGSCDIEITKYDINNIIIPYLKNNYSQRIIFSRSTDKDEEQGFNWFLAQIINKKIFGNGDTCIETYMQARIDYEDDYVSFSIVGESNSEEAVDNLFDGRLYKSILYFDLITIRDFYAQRYLCVTNIENYINIKVLEYFDNVVSLLNKDDTQHMLYLYLLSNCFVMNIVTPYEIKRFEKSVDEYPVYAASIKPINGELYEKIKVAINKL